MFEWFFAGGGGDGGDVRMNDGPDGNREKLEWFFDCHRRLRRGPILRLRQRRRRRLRRRQGANTRGSENGEGGGTNKREDGEGGDANGRGEH